MPSAQTALVRSNLLMSHLVEEWKDVKNDG